MARPRNPEKSVEIEEVIARLFAYRGYQATSMREIARELGMNPSSLYHYFSSKEEILFKLMNEAMGAALVTLDAICREPLPPRERLEKVLNFYIRYYAGDQERLVLLVNEMNSLTEEHRLLLAEKQRKYVTLISSILEELSGWGELKDLDATIAAFAFFGMVHYTIKWYHRDGPVDLDRLAQNFVEIFTGGVLAGPGTDAN